MIAALALAAALTQSMPDPAEAEVVAVLDALEAASSSGDGDAYFALFTPEARFVGTDGTEHWDMPAFRAFAQRYFDRDGPAWSFPATERFITILPIECRCVALFEEKLNSAHYGESRGSGALRRTADGWKIEQYVLSFAVPNDRSDAVVAAIQGDAAD